MGTDTTAIIILVGGFFLLMFMRVGVGFAMGIASIATFIYLRLPLELVVQYTIGGVNVFTF